MDKCEYCGFEHSTLCPKIKSIEYEMGEWLPDGGHPIKKIEFHDPFAHTWFPLLPANPAPSYEPMPIWRAPIIAY